MFCLLVKRAVAMCFDVLDIAIPVSLYTTEHPTTLQVYRHPTTVLQVYRHPTMLQVYRHPTMLQVYRHSTMLQVYRHLTASLCTTVTCGVDERLTTRREVRIILHIRSRVNLPSASGVCTPPATHQVYVYRSAFRASGAYIPPLSPSRVCTPLRTVSGVCTLRRSVSDAHTASSHRVPGVYTPQVLRENDGVLWV